MLIVDYVSDFENVQKRRKNKKKNVESTTDNHKLRNCPTSPPVLEANAWKFMFSEIFYKLFIL